MLGDMSKLLERVQSGEVSDSRESVTDCLVALIPLIVGEWIRGESPLAHELDHLVRCLRNPEDPTVQALPMGLGMMLRMQLSQLSALKEQHHAQKSD